MTPSPRPSPQRGEGEGRDTAHSLSPPGRGLGEGLTKEAMQRDPVLLSRARENRAEMPTAEQALWQRLRANRLNGIKFTRQVVIGPYIADFAARREKLVIELDGDSHADRIGYDAARTAFLEREGYRVLRFDNKEIRTNLDGGLDVIVAAMEMSYPSPRPSPQRGEGEVRDAARSLSPPGRGLGRGASEEL